MEAATPPRPPDYEFEWGPSSQPPSSSSSSAPRSTPELSPPLIAMLAVVGAAFLIVLYARILSRHLRSFSRRWRRWRRRRRLLRSTTGSSPGSPLPHFDSSSDYFLSPYGLDAAAIGTLPLSLFSAERTKYSRANRECAVCLLEFEPGESLRTLPLCAHGFHVDCIDVWLRSHATCPLCRSAVFRVESPFVPMRAARIRPSIDDLTLLEEAAAAEHEINNVPALAESSPRRDRDWFLKRSYSFGFERTERMEAATASPWRYRSRSFWSKRWPSPFGGSASASRAGGGRVFSFRSYRSGGTMMMSSVSGKSPFMRRRGWFQPLSSEPRMMMGGWSSASRRSRSMASPSAIFMRGSSSSAAAASSRMRCGDPEALLSPERLNRR